MTQQDARNKPLKTLSMRSYWEAQPTTSPKRNKA
jgi:hypothetical protein